MRNLWAFQVRHLQILWKQTTLCIIFPVVHLSSLLPSVLRPPWQLKAVGLGRQWRVSTARLLSCRQSDWLQRKTPGWSQTWPEHGSPRSWGWGKKRDILSFLVLFPSCLAPWKSIEWSIVGFELCTTCSSFSDRNLWCLGFRHSNVSGQVWELSQPSWVTSYSHEGLCNSRREV